MVVVCDQTIILLGAEPWLDPVSTQAVLEPGHTARAAGSFE